MYRDILYVLDRGHGLQAPCGESGSDCGFSAGFAGLQINDSSPSSRGNVGIPAGISKGCGKGGKPALWLSMLSIPRHFRGLFSVELLFRGSQYLGAKPVVRERNPNSPKEPSTFCHTDTIELKGNFRGVRHPPRITRCARSESEYSFWEVRRFHFNHRNSGQIPHPTGWSLFFR